MFRSDYQCTDCGGSAAYSSRRRTVLEKYVLPLFLLKPVRCVNCFRRTNASMFLPVQARESKPSAKRHAAA
jgi:hypothetical protein